MKKNLSFLALSALILVFASCTDQKKELSGGKAVTNTNSSEKLVTHKTFGRAFNFIIVSDWGWNGYKHQQEVADQMTKTADSTGVKFIVSCGDNFQTNGVASTRDPLWMFNYENIYKGPSLNVDWYPVLGNHDYRGSPTAEI